MSKAVLNMAKRYYPTHWTLEHLNALLKKGALTQDEYSSLVLSTDGDDENE